MDERKDQTHWSNQGPLHSETDNPTFFLEEPKNRDCNNCTSKKSKLDMVLNGCSATVDYCKKGHILYKARPCEDEVKSLGAIVRDIFK